MFEIKDATFEVNGKPILNPIEHTFHEGKVYGLIGHNGSGKSTLIKLMAQQQPVARGAIHFDQRPLSDWGHREFARQVAYLPQHLPSAESLTGRELVGFGRYPWHGLLGRHTQADKEAVERAIALTHTEAFADRLVDTLSGGERQRVAVATVLTQAPSLWLADEPTNHLDLHHQSAVMALMAEQAAQGSAVMMCLHDLNLAARWCDHILLLYPSGEACWGPRDTMLVPSALERLYQQRLATVDVDGAPVFVPIQAPLTDHE